MHQSFQQLPEKVLQFGTGVLLRGLPDFFIHEANQKGTFEGSIVVVKSTPGSAQAFTDQQGKYAICVRGIRNGEVVEENLENTSISRVLLANESWSAILEAAANPQICLMVSNTTEVGIQLLVEDITNGTPVSFPGKLTALLYERYKKLAGKSPKVVVVPTELIPDNGKLLKQIVVQVAGSNGLGSDFLHWLDTHTIFCSSLVDRIVTPPSDDVKLSFPYHNELTIQTEPYKLWAIEGDETVRSILEFAKGDDDVIIAPDIQYYRERKLRLLNGTGTVMASLGFLLGRNTTYECMMDPEMGLYTEQAMLEEVEPTLPEETRHDTIRFAHEVLERWRNPFIVHKLLSVTVQATAKMKMRNVATLIRYANTFGKTPNLLAKGFAAHLLFMRVVRQEGAEYFGRRNDEFYPIRDDQAGYFKELWKGVEPTNKVGVKKMVASVVSDQKLWGEDLSVLPEFINAVTSHAMELTKRIGRQTERQV